MCGPRTTDIPKGYRVFAPSFVTATQSSDELRLNLLYQWSGQKSGSDSAVSFEFVIAGMIFHPSRVQS
jgi:hypothetical protein